MSRLALFLVALALVAPVAAGAAAVPAAPKGLRAVLTAGGFQYVGGHRSEFRGRPTVDYLSRSRDHRRARFAIGTGRGPAYTLGVAIGYKTYGPARLMVEDGLGMRITRVSTWGSWVVLHLTKR